MTKANFDTSRPAKDEETTLFSAGSLRVAMPEILRAFQLVSGVAINATFGPAGMLRERIENGEPVDIFASADTGNPGKLVSAGWGDSVSVFALNTACAMAKPSVGLTTRTFLDRALDPAIRLGTSTPISDVSGDVAWKVFENAEKVRAGSFAALDAKALKLVGGPDTVAIPEGKSSVGFLFEENYADMFLGFRTTAKDAVARGLPIVVADLPKELDVETTYGLAVSRSAGAAAYRLGLFMLSAPAQAILVKHGFSVPSTR